MDFEQMPLLHHNPTGIDFGMAHLVSYDYSAQRLTPGDDLLVISAWEGDLENISATASLVSPAVHLLNASTVWAQAEVPLAPQTTFSLSVPSDTAPGLALIRLDVSGVTGELLAASPAGRTLGATFLLPVWVEAAEPAPSDSLAAFAQGAIRLHSLEATHTSAAELAIQFSWSATRTIPENLGLSLRLVDQAGNEWGRLETQPGYGFMPTSLWPPGYLLHDRVTLNLPPGTPPSSSYDLTTGLYRVATWEGVGDLHTPVSLDIVTMMPEAPIIANLGAGLALSSLEEFPRRIEQGRVLRWTAYWVVIEQPVAAVAEWSLAGPEVFSATLDLAPGSETNSWPVGAWVAGRVNLPLAPSAEPGSYTLALTLLDSDGQRLGSYTHPRHVNIEERERVTQLPPMEHTVGADFGDMIRLAGYDLEQTGDTLRVTLHWQALQVPDRHYMLFVHVADQTTAIPVTQTDTMPREFTYPTGTWAEGEVVSDQVVIPLTETPQGTYDLALGWYDPETRTRLDAQDRLGNQLAEGRVVLESITLP
jgi:hypothetical protein